MVISQNPTEAITSYEDAATEEKDGELDSVYSVSGVLETVNKVRPTFGNIAVSNSTDIHFGDKTYYQGPVTIKQFLYANSNVGKDAVQLEEGGVLVRDCDEGLGEIGNGRCNPILISDELVGKNNNFKEGGGRGKGKEETAKAAGKWTYFTPRQYLYLITGTLIALLIVGTTLGTVLVLNTGQNDGRNLPASDYDEDGDDGGGVSPTEDPLNFTLPEKLKIIPRKEWLAQPPVLPLDNLTLPVPYVIISHTAGPFCYKQSECTYLVRILQTFHIESRGFYDIGYNFLVGGDGYAYEGRGWKKEGSHTYGFNKMSIGISFIGTFNTEAPNKIQYEACKKLIKIGVEMGYIAQDYKLFGARQFQSTLSPGNVIYEEIKQWPHWAPAP
nr:peptidoglycan-recognition protein LF [Lasioderma serricorne]